MNTYLSIEFVTRIKHTCKISTYFNIIFKSWAATSGRNLFRQEKRNKITNLKKHGQSVVIRIVIIIRYLCGESETSPSSQPPVLH